MSDDSERFERAYELFIELCDASPAERELRLATVAHSDAELVVEVVRLLEVDATDGALDGSASELVTSFRPAGNEAALPLPEKIGEFEIVGRLGEGGMGLVFEAIQESPRRRVALKVVRPGFLSSAQIVRFRREAEVLAWLEHPGIAQIFAAGTAETEAGPQPYIAMELVRGVRIDEFADRKGLDGRARIDLVAQLCEAVHHAHQRGVVHRDLKPANVLVTDEGRLKVLDFGIARVTDADLVRATGATSAGEVLGTLPYMSPEQVGAEPDQFDARTDVYALGVLAYQLLSGSLPLDVSRSSLAEAARRIVHDEPTSLGRLDSRWRGDVEWIVAKALAKKKTERYASADDLAADFRRHLNDEPITARPPSTIDQVAKFTRRNRGLVAGLVAAFVALAVGAIVATILLVKTSRLLVERDREVVAANEAVTFLEGLFEQTDPLAPGDVKLSDFARRASRRFETELLDRPRLRARLLDAIAKTFIDLSLLEDAAPLLEESLAIRAQFGEADSLAYAQTLERSARIDQHMGRYADALEKHRTVRRIREEKLGDSLDLSDSINNIAVTLSVLRPPEEAEVLYEEAVAMAERALPPGDPRLLSKRLNLAVHRALSGRAREAETSLVALTVAAKEAPVGLQVRIWQQLAWALRLEMRYDEALPAIETAIDLALDAYGYEASLLRELVGARGTILTGMGRTREAVESLRQFRLAVIDAVGARTQSAANATADLAFAVHDLPPPECEEALELYGAAREIFLESAGPETPALAMLDLNEALLLERLGRFDEAVELSLHSLERRERRMGPDNSNTLASLRGYAGILESMGALEEAVDAYREYLERASRVHGPGATLVQRARLVLSRTLVRLDRIDEAAEVLDDLESALDVTHDSERKSLEVRLANARAGLVR